MNSPHFFWPDERNLLPVLHHGNFYDADPGETIEPRYVQDFQLQFVQAGSGFVLQGKEKKRIHAGDLIYHPCNKLHGLTASRQDPLRLISVHFLFFAQDELLMKGEHVHYSRPRPFVFRGKKPRSVKADIPLLLRVGLHHPLRRVLEQIVLSHVASPEGRFLEKRGLLLRGFEFWKHIIASAETHSKLDEHHINMLQKVEAHIIENLQKDLAVAEVARLVRLQPDYLTRLFKDYSGMGLKQFIIAQKMTRARRLLVENFGTVAEIAYEVGFNDPLYFSRLFAKKFGFAPSELRKNHTIF